MFKRFSCFKNSLGYFRMILLNDCCLWKFYGCLLFKSYNLRFETCPRNFKNFVSNAKKANIINIRYIFTQKQFIAMAHTYKKVMHSSYTFTHKTIYTLDKNVLMHLLNGLPSFFLSCLSHTLQNNKKTRHNNCKITSDSFIHGLFAEGTSDKLCNLLKQRLLKCCTFSEIEVRFEKKFTRGSAFNTVAKNCCTIILHSISVLVFGFPFLSGDCEERKEKREKDR